LANRTGHVDGPPLVPRGPVDTIAGMHAAFAAVVAVSQRDRLGVGQLVEVPLIEGALAVAAEQVIAWSAYGEVLERMGNRSALAAPQGLYRSVDDEWVAISVRTNGQFEALCSLVQGLDNLDRHGDIDAVDDLLDDFSRLRLAEDSVELLVAAGVPAAVCVHANDSAETAQHAARGFVQPMEHEIAGTVPYLGFPMQIDGETYRLGDPAPTLGQHTAQVLGSLGLDDAEIADLQAQGVTGDWPKGVPRR
ncbi:MAG: CoA transferase, partial [Acidobacteria bacterium]|nr:CoA transferase [Acidobacteriota bacterium]